MYNNRLWGTVCDSSWNIQDAHTVCRQLAFSPATAYYHNAAYGQGSGHIWMNSVACTGNELNIGQCRFSGWDNNVCSHKHDSSVCCASAGINTNSSKASLSTKNVVDACSLYL